MASILFNKDVNNILFVDFNGLEMIWQVGRNFEIQLLTWEFLQRLHYNGLNILCTARLCGCYADLWGKSMTGYVTQRIWDRNMQFLTARLVRTSWLLIVSIFEIWGGVSLRSPCYYIYQTLWPATNRTRRESIVHNFLRNIRMAVKNHLLVQITIAGIRSALQSELHVNEHSAGVYVRDT